MLQLFLVVPRMEGQVVFSRVHNLLSVFAKIKLQSVGLTWITKLIYSDAWILIIYHIISYVLITIKLF